MRPWEGFTKEEKERARTILSEAFAPIGFYKGNDGKYYARNEGAAKRMNHIMDYRKK
jgi:hypothetical protein